MRLTTLILMLGLVGVSAEPLVASTLIPQEHKPWVAPARKARLKNPVPFSPEAVARGRKIYAPNCIACHGDSGKGDGAAAVALNPKPADLSLPALQAQSDGSMYWKLSKGRAPMPAFDPALTDTQRWELVHYLRSLGPPPTPEDMTLTAYGKMASAMEKGKARAFKTGARELKKNLAKLPGPSKWKGLSAEASAKLQKGWSAQLKKATTVCNAISAKDFKWEQAASSLSQLTSEMATLLDLMPKKRIPHTLTLWRNVRKDGQMESWLQWAGKGARNPYSAERRKNGKAEKTWKP